MPRVLFPYRGGGGGGGGSSSPQLPAWTFDPATDGAPAAGHFQADNTSPILTTTLNVNVLDKSGSDWGNMLQQGLPDGAFIIFTNSSGNTCPFYVEPVPAPVAGVITITVQHAGDPVSMATWSGQNTVSFAAGPANVRGPTSSTVFNLATFADTTGLLLQDGGPVPTLGSLIFGASITPIPDGVYPTSATLGGSTTYMSGLAIANEEAS